MTSAPALIASIVARTRSSASSPVVELDDVLRLTPKRFDVPVLVRQSALSENVQERVVMEWPFA
jgi:hypothetical protein